MELHFISLPSRACPPKTRTPGPSPPFSRSERGSQRSTARLGSPIRAPQRPPSTAHARPARPGPPRARARARGASSLDPRISHLPLDSPSINPAAPSLETPSISPGPWPTSSPPFLFTCRDAATEERKSVMIGSAPTSAAASPGRQGRARSPENARTRERENEGSEGDRRRPADGFQGRYARLGRARAWLDSMSTARRDASSNSL